MIRPGLAGSVGLVLLAHAALAAALLQGGSPSPAAAQPRSMVLVRIASPNVNGTAAPPLAGPAAAAAPVRPGRPATPAALPAGRTDAGPHGLAVTLDKEFVPASQLERPALPRSAPDLALIQGLSWSGLPMRMRLYVDAQGSVVDVRVLQASEDDEAIERVRRMFLATGFIPGRAHGVDVASYKDIELRLGGPG